ncbi:Molybdopterin synthase catalytic subunit [Thelotrema lepadinum]|nr:Molybdopterin synthase catalytic subunit [Thelotrema lepadinum]
MPSADDPPPRTVTINHPGIHLSLTPDPLSIDAITSHVRSPKAGAIVIFAGKPPPLPSSYSFIPSSLPPSHFTPLPPLTPSPHRHDPRLLRQQAREIALTLLGIARGVKEKYGLQGIAMVHRLGTVPIGEESIIIAVSAPHRTEAWRAGEEALELCKEKVEVWKMEEFEGGEGVWRANRDGAVGERVGGSKGVEREREE